MADSTMYHVAFSQSCTKGFAHTKSVFKKESLTVYV